MRARMWERGGGRGPHRWMHYPSMSAPMGVVIARLAFEVEGHGSLFFQRSFSASKNNNKSTYGTSVYAIKRDFKVIYLYENCKALGFPEGPH